MFIVIKSLTRKYGYSHQWVGPNCPSYVVGPQHTCHWYKYKREAIKRAEDFNKQFKGELK